MSFKRAERKKAKLRLALCGPSGSGKTYSAILIAQGIGAKIAMIDTEHHSGELYSHLTNYDVASLEAPYSPERYINLIEKAEQDDYDVLIIDSLSHAWAGEGGVLDMVDKAAKSTRSQNSYAAWRYVTPEHNKLVEKILKSNLHIIATIRAKTDYEKSTDDKGKMKIEKVGLAPVQREGLDYEFTTVLDLNVDGHIARSSKDRTGIFDNKFITPNIDTGKHLLEWLGNGNDILHSDKDLSDIYLESCLSNMHLSDSLEELKKNFDYAQEKFRNYPTQLKMIIEVKDKRKKELLFFSQTNENKNVTSLLRGAA